MGSLAHFDILLEYAFPFPSEPVFVFAVQQNNNYYPMNNNQNDDRIIGSGFLGPFVLGGITGGLVAPYFYPRPYYPMYYQPYPMRPYPRRWY